MSDINPELSRSAVVDWVALAVVALVAAGRFLFFDIFYPNIDTVTHYRWAVQFASEVGAGVWHPRWTPLGHNGLGEPAFLYYPPLFFYFVTAARMVTGDIWAAIKLVVWVAYFATGAAVHFALRRSVGRGFAFLAAVAVVAAPMTFAVRALINAYPWFTSIPILVVFVALSVRTTYRSVSQTLLLGFVFAGLVLTHILTAFTALVSIGFGLTMAAAFARDHPKPALRRLSVWSAGCGLGIGLSSYYLLPALLNLNLINPIGWHNAGGVHWWDTFAFQFFFTAQVHSLYWLVPSTVYLLFGVTLAVFCARRMNVTYRAEAALLLSIAATALFLACEASYPVWHLFEPLQFVQRPFRFLPIATITTVMALTLVSGPSRRGRDWVAALLLCLLFLAPTIVLEVLNKDLLANYRGPHMNIGPNRLAEPYQLPEYSVAGLPPDWDGYQRAGGLAGQCGRMGLACRDLSSSAHHRYFAVVAPHPVVLPLPLLAFPAWKATVNGASAATGRDSMSGVLTVAIPAGSVDIRVFWSPLPSERAGMAISLITMAVMLGAAIWSLYGRGPIAAGGNLTQKIEPGD